MDIEKLFVTPDKMLQLRNLGFTPKNFTFMYYHCNGEWIWCIAETFLASIRHDDILPTLTLQEILEIIPDNAEIPNKCTVDFQCALVNKDGPSMLKSAFDVLSFCVSHGLVR